MQKQFSSRTHCCRHSTSRCLTQHIISRARGEMFKQKKNGGLMKLEEKAQLEIWWKFLTVADTLIKNQSLSITFNLYCIFFYIQFIFNFLNSIFNEYSFIFNLYCTLLYSLYYFQLVFQCRINASLGQIWHDSFWNLFMINLTSYTD